MVVGQMPDEGAYGGPWQRCWGFPQASAAVAGSYRPGPRRARVDGMTESDRRPRWLNWAAYPFVDRHHHVGGCRVHYVDEGRGPVLVFLHGNPTWSYLYRGVIRRLRGSFRCIALDLPGFGLSTTPPGYRFTPAEQARVVEDFLLDLDLRDITLMVQDWGGPIGLAAAARHPDRFRALVISNTWAWPTTNPALIRFSRVMGGPVGRFAVRYGNAFVTVLLPLALRRRPGRAVRAAYRRPFAARSARTPMHVLPREILASRDHLAEVEQGCRQALSDLPTLIIWGERDRALHRAEWERFERIFPRHDTVLLPQAGHFLVEDAPAEVAAAIRRWHRGLPPLAPLPGTAARGAPPSPGGEPGAGARSGGADHVRQQDEKNLTTQVRPPLPSRGPAADRR
jgi:haloalkane dehalogenase